MSRRESARSRCVGSTSRRTTARADLRSVQAALDCDQINIVGTNNVVLASTDPDSVGFDMTSASETDEFTALNRGEIAFKTQLFRRSRGCRPGGDGGAWFKYAALPFPGGGYVNLRLWFHQGLSGQRVYFDDVAAENHAD